MTYTILRIHSQELIAMRLAKSLLSGGRYLALATILITAFPLLAKAQQCAFNGKQESCSLTRIMTNGIQTGTKVKWLSDGKVVSYYFYNCKEYPGGEDCKVKIVEDNGRTTYGSSSHGGRGTSIVSNKGNRTAIPPF